MSQSPRIPRIRLRLTLAGAASAVLLLATWSIQSSAPSAEINMPGLVGADAGYQGRGGEVEFQDVELVRRAPAEILVERHKGLSGAASLRRSSTRVVHQDAAHEFRHQPHERRLAPGRHLSLIAKSQQGLVDQGGGLQGMAGSLALHEIPGQGSQLGVDQRYQPVPGAGLAGRPFLQQPRHFAAVIAHEIVAMIAPVPLRGPCVHGPGLKDTCHAI